MDVTPQVIQPQLQLNLSKYPKLSDAQVGHIRHFHNLAFQPDGSWHHMGSQEPMQEFLDAYRYQLAIMSYAVGVTHFHRMPALRGVFKPLFRRLIHKMLRREVWGYWFLTSHSGIITDPDLRELRKPWADPVARENIMYSGHLLLMTSLYGMLFDDDEFEKPDSIVFKWDPLYWGMGPETFSYDNRNLQKVILAEMERNGWVGVCCEPNAVFVVCNQFPIIAMRYNDVRDGTSITDEVLEKYKAAWDKKGMVSKDGLFVDWMRVKQQTVYPPDVPYGTLPPRELGFTAWAAAYMNAWNTDFVKSKFDQQSMGYITKINGEIRLRPMAVAAAFRSLVNDQGYSAESPKTLDTAIEAAKSLPPFPYEYVAPTYGCVAQWFSELGKSAELEAILEYADNHLSPTWERGGLFYPRRDGQTSPDGDWTHMDPFTGNAGIAYARLNVPDGQKIMWEQAWTKEVLASRPYIDGIGMDQEVDYIRGTWDEAENALILTVRTWDGSTRTLRPCVKNLAEGRWTEYVNGKFRQAHEVKAGASITTEFNVAGEEVDAVWVMQ